MGTTIYLVRHGRTLFNTLHKVQGWCDTPLTAEGREVARDLGRGLKARGVDFEAAYCGDLGRHRETARLILEEMGRSELPVQEMEGLREACFGSWEGEWERVRDQVFCERTGAASMLELFQRGFAEVDRLLVETDTTGLAEPGEKVLRRMRAALGEICRQHPGGAVLVVSSGGSIVTLLDSLGAARMLDNASVSLLYESAGALSPGPCGDMSYAELGKRLRANKNE